MRGTRKDDARVGDSSRGTCFAFPQAMSLSKYTQTRLVTQRPGTCVYDAIRAMEDNHVGTVIVHDGRRRSQLPREMRSILSTVWTA